MAHKVYIRHSGEVVSRHPLARQGFAQTLSRISDRDYPRKGYFADTDIPAIDIDTYETSRPGGNSRTADAAIGICDESGGRRTRHRLLLVELRMDYSTVTNLHVGEMTEKELHSRELIADTETDIDKTMCLIFRPDLEQQAINWVNRKKRTERDINDWKCLSPATLLNYINYNIRIPYEPLEETKSRAGRFADTCATGDIEAVSREWDNVRSYLTQCNLRYQLAESRWLSAETLRSIDGMTPKPDTTEEAEILLEILREEIGQYAKKANTD